MKTKLVLIFVACTFLAACKIDLYSSLDEREANEMVGLLQQRGIKVYKSEQTDGLFAIQVEESDSIPAFAVLQNHGLPREKRKSCDEMHQSGGMIVSKAEENARNRCELKKSVEDLLSHMSGVITARVELVMPEKNPYADEPEPSSATAYLKTRHDVNLNPRRSEIKRMIMTSIEGLTYSNVTLEIESASSFLEQSSDMKAIERARTNAGQASSRVSDSTSQFYWVLGAVLLLLATVALVLLYRRGVKQREVMATERALGGPDGDSGQLGLPGQSSSNTADSSLFPNRYSQSAAVADSRKQAIREDRTSGPDDSPRNMSDAVSRT